MGLRTEITDTTEMEDYIEKATDLFKEMVVPKHAEGASSQAFNASMDLMEEMHALVAKYQTKVERGEYYEKTVLTTKNMPMKLYTITIQNEEAVAWVETENGRAVAHTIPVNLLKVPANPVGLTGADIKWIAYADAKITEHYR
jgi:hypothetical protein